MGTQGVSRRDVLRSLVVGATAGSVLQMIPAQAAEYAHGLVESEKAASVTGKYVPKYFSAHQYETLTSLCDTIIPKDEKSGGAVEAGAPEFIDLITSENVEYQTQFGGGLMWLDNHCLDEFGKVYMECTPEQRKIKLINSGIYCFKSGLLWCHIDEIKPNPVSAAHGCSAVAAGRVGNHRTSYLWRMLYPCTAATSGRHGGLLLMLGCLFATCDPDNKPGAGLYSGVSAVLRAFP